MPQPAQPKIYHIVHVDRLLSIIADGFLWSDATISTRGGAGTTIGMSGIKARRLELELDSHPRLHVGECVPFYFCPRSVMLYLLHQGNHPDLTYRGGQGPILHLEADLHAAVSWAKKHAKRWAFTLSNAGARYFEDRCKLSELAEIDWEAVESRKWSGGTVASSVKEGKQAEFLLEEKFPWSLVERVGVHSASVGNQVAQLLKKSSHKPPVSTQSTWYY
jgi:hypothetical protein